MSPQAVNVAGLTSVGGDGQLNRQKHVNYWKRCLKTFLPQAYTSTDSNRMLLAFFIVSACDLLDVLHEQTKPEELQGYIDWIYHCQHPDGGFRGFPGGDFGTLRNNQNKMWDPATVPATYLALSALLILRDDLSRVKRTECLQWLRKLQRPDGSFGETVGENDRIEGGFDSRFGYCAMVSRWILRGATRGDVDGVPDIDIEQLVRSVLRAQTYDGGISEAPFHESHGGFAYCSIGILSLLRRLPPAQHAQPNLGPAPEPRPSGIDDLDLLLHWLVSCQTDILEEGPVLNALADQTGPSRPRSDRHGDLKANAAEPQEVSSESQLGSDVQWAGFNGRCNKIADTCYCFWVLGALSMLNAAHLADLDACRRYLLQRTQHLVGGFGKAPGDPPDIYHSYLGLATLSLMGDPQVKPIVPSACFSQDTARFLENLVWRQNITGTEDTGLPQGFAYD